MLECLSFGSSHTGIELAKSILGVLQKFQIQDQVWGVVCDNASNNAAMMKQLAKSKLKRLNGPLARVFCILHVLNLVATAIMRPFHLKCRQLTSNEDAANSDDDGSKVFFGHNETEPDDSDIDKDDDGTAPSQMLREDGDDTDNSDDEEEEGSVTEYMLPTLIKGSSGGTGFNRSTKVLFEAAKLARKLRYTPAAKAAFKSACVKAEVKTLHNVQCNMKVRWNSTHQMLEDVNRTFAGIIQYQDSTRFTPCDHLLREEDQETIQHLLAVLTPIRGVSEILSRGSVPMLADVIPHYDGLTDRYEKIHANPDFLLYIRHAAHRAWKVLNKYYSMMDESHLYWLAIHEWIPETLTQMIGANQKVRWEPEWIENAVDIAVGCWKEHYRPEKKSEDTQQSVPTSQFAYSSFLDQMFMESPASEPQADLDAACVHKFIHGQIYMETTPAGRSIPTNPLVWWNAQRVAGNEWDGLTQMALDVLSVAASSVDVERAFLFTGSIVSKRRHSLAPYSIQATATLGSYSKAGLVRHGSLELPRKGYKGKKEAARTDVDDQNLSTNF